MKIICVDNFDRESRSDRLVCENISKREGEFVVSALNHKYSGPTSGVFYRLVEDDYELYTFEP